METRLRNPLSELTLTPKIICLKFNAMSGATCPPSLESLTSTSIMMATPRRGAGAEQAPGHGDLLVQGVAGQLPGGSKVEPCVLTPAMVIIR